MFSNPLQLIQAIQNSGNPQQFVYNMVNEQMGQNPLFANLLSLAKKGDGASIEKIARNIMAEKGINYDQAFTQFKNQLGLK